MVWTETPRPADTTNSSSSPRADTADIKVGKDIKATTTLASTSQENAVQKVEITTFQDVEAPAVAITPMAQNTASIAHFDNTFDLKEFLRRPVKLSHFQLDVGEKYKLNEFTERDPQRPVASWNLPGDILKHGGKLDKVRNHQFFKADVRVKITLNTNPFVAGRFYLTYSPYENRITEARQQQWASRAGVTAYPGVEIDAQLDNSVEITIPFASYKESYVLTDAQDFATLNLFAITPVMGADGAHIDMAIYAWFENIELNIPTLKDPSGLESTQVIVERPLSATQMERMNLGRRLLKLKQSNKLVYDYVIEQMARTDVVKGTMQVQAEAQGNPISDIAGTVKDVADIVKEVPIPIVSEIATGVSWVADIIKGISSIFGWSKPHSYTQVAPLQNVPGKFYTHYDTEDQSVSLSLTAKNELDKLNNIFPSAVDEMDLGYVCANPAIKYIYTWKSTSNAGENFTTVPLGLIPVGIGSFTAKELAASEGFSQESVFDAKAISGCPGQNCDEWGGFVPYMCFNKTAEGSRSLYRTSIRSRGTLNNFILSTAPCEYVSQLFKYWRATICFKISVVKTAFHTGRLEIFFDPGMYEPIAVDEQPTTFIDPNLTFYTDKDTTNNYKFILDLTNDTEVTIRIPFVSEKLFLSTKGLNGGLSMPTISQVADSIIGSLVIRPISNLMCPATVKDEVSIIVWKWAEDVVLSCPINSGGTDLSIYDRDHVPEFPDIYMTDIPKEIVRNLPLEIGPGVVEKKVCGSMQINIGNKAEGNVITFFSTTDVETENMNACKNAAGERLVNLRPLLRIFREYLSYTGTKEEGINEIINAQAEDDKVRPDYLSYLSYMYRFFRGGFRYKILSDGERVTTNLLENGQDSGKLTPSHITFPSLNPIHEVAVPYYSQYRKLPISTNDAGIMKLRIKTDGQKADLLRAGNDDLTFGWLMGTPQLMPGNGSITWKSIEKLENQEPTRDIICDIQGDKGLLDKIKVGTVKAYGKTASAHT